MIDFKDSQFNNLKELIDTEKWERLPLPDNYEVKEFYELLRDYPKDFKNDIKIFDHHYSTKLREYPKNNIFAQFLDGNPFDSSTLMNESKVASPDKISSKKKQVPSMTKMMQKRNPFQNQPANEDDEIKEEDLDEDIDIGMTIRGTVASVDTKIHSNMFYQQMNAVSQNIIISSSGLNVVKSFFKYVELLNVLAPYSFEILLGITQLFEFYVFAVFFLYSDEENQK